MDQSRALKKRLKDSEESRESLIEKMEIMEKEWEKRLENYSEVLIQKQSARLKSLETLVEEQSEIITEQTTQIEDLKEEQNLLHRKLNEADERNEDNNENTNEHDILRKQIDLLLKEKTNLSIENAELKSKLTRYELNIVGSNTSPTKQGVPLVATPKRKIGGGETPLKSPRRNLDHPVSPMSKSIDSLALPQTEDELELRSKILAFFEKKYPGTRVNQVNKSKLFLTEALLKSMERKPPSNCSKAQ